MYLVRHSAELASKCSPWSHDWTFLEPAEQRK